MRVAPNGLDDYFSGLFNPEDEMLKHIREEAETQGLPAIQVKPEIGRLLQLLILQSGATRILEIGALFGYSAILMARALPPNGRLITLEVEPKHAALARRNIERAGQTEKIQLIEGPALPSLAALRDDRFDLVFIDADKNSYPDYLEYALELTHSGSTIVADNVWRDGAVVAPEENDEANLALSRFNRALAQNARLFTVIFPRLDSSDATSVSLVRD